MIFFKKERSAYKELTNKIYDAMLSASGYLDEKPISKIAVEDVSMATPYLNEAHKLYKMLGYDKAIETGLNKLFLIALNIDKDLM